MIDLTHGIARHDVAPGRRGARRRAPLRAGRGSTSRSSTRASARPRRAVAVRVAERSGSSSAPTTACSRRRSSASAARSRRSTSRARRSGSSRSRRPSTAATCSPRSPRTWRWEPSSAALGEPLDPGRARSRSSGRAPTVEPGARSWPRVSHVDALRQRDPRSPTAERGGRGRARARPAADRSRPAARTARRASTPPPSPTSPRASCCSTWTPSGDLALAVNRGSAAERLGARRRATRSLLRPA